MEYQFSQNEIKNLNKLFFLLKKAVEDDTLSVDQMTEAFLFGMREFNSIPSFTFFTFEDSGIIDLVGYRLTEAAAIYMSDIDPIRTKEFEAWHNTVKKGKLILCGFDV